MSDIAPLGRPSAAGYASHSVSSRPTATNAAPTRGSDRVELSRTAQLLSKISDLPDVRQDVIDRVRAEIEAGTYETPERLDKAAEALAQELQDS